MAKRKSTTASVTGRPGTTRVNSFRDPRVLSELRNEAGRPVDMPLAVGLDLGTNTGVAAAFFNPERHIAKENLDWIALGQLDLSTNNNESGPMRLVKLWSFLEAMRPSIIFYERVRNTPPMPATRPMMAAILARVATTAELVGAFYGIVTLFAEINAIPCMGLAIGELKHRATGRGNANKIDMIEACNAYHGTDFASEGYELTGVDNIADASWALVRGLELYGSGVSIAPPRFNLSRVTTEDLIAELSRRSDEHGDRGSRDEPGGYSIADGKRAGSEVFGGE